MSYKCRKVKSTTFRTSVKLRPTEGEAYAGMRLWIVLTLHPRVNFDMKISKIVPCANPDIANFLNDDRELNLTNCLTKVDMNQVRVFSKICGIFHAFKVKFNSQSCVSNTFSQSIRTTPLTQFLSKLNKREPISRDWWKYTWFLSRKGD